MRRKMRRCRSSSASTVRRLAMEHLQSRIVLDASLSGAVYIDADADARRDPGELGVPGVVITLSGQTSSGTAVQRSTMTQSDGSYTFSGLAAGNYQVSQRQPRALVDGQDSTDASAALINNDVITNIVLADGQQSVNNHFGEQHVRPQFINITWLFASAPPKADLLRQAVARGEELAGDAALAQAIRAGQSEVPGATNTQPIAVNDSFEIASNQVLNVLAGSGVLKNDHDPEGATLTAQLVAAPANGTLTLNSDGGLTYAPHGSFRGTDSFTYRAHDGSLASNTATVTIIVEEPPAPEAAPNFTLTDVNPHSSTHNEGVSPREYLEQVSGWYFGHST